MKSFVFLGCASLLLGACATGPDLVVDGPNMPPEKPAYDAYVPEKVTMDDFILAAGSNTVLFSTNSSILDSQAREILERQAAWMMTHPDVDILVEGHADMRASDNYNIKLARARANAVVDFFVMKGLTRDRFTARSFGEGKPVIDQPGDVQLNRRAVTVIMESDSDTDRVMMNR
jgi:peptidoglycan-associated lipoprotein